jgi:phosphoribosylaminoimidazolecarboxamide formyltransferase/IMP cyclohydrolase
MRAVLSVYDKTGIVELAQGLAALGVELVSSGGTARVLTEAGVPVRPVEELTGFPEILGHRVVTLHPKVHGGILADRDLPEHRADLERHGIEPIDLVVVNLYPFAQEPSVELIDIGGPAMARAAAKNHAHVTVVVDPADYPAVLKELREHGRVSPDTRRRLAAKVFALTSAYDAQVAAWLAAGESPVGESPVGESHVGESPAVDPLLPDRLTVVLERSGEALRYGENPHQRAARYRLVGEPGFWDQVVQHAGVPLSYLNLYDADAAWTLVHDLASWSGQPAAVIVKHANPCGAALAPSLAEAYERAYRADERSAFGGIVALSAPLDAPTAAAMVQAAQADVVIAPGYAPGTIEQLQARRKSTRLLEAPPPRPALRHFRQISGGFLVQEPPGCRSGRDAWRVVTQRVPSEAEWRDAELAWRICAQVKSNAIVLVKDGQAVGIGAGQQNRVQAGEIAAQKAAGRAKGGACASDAFYPFPDGVEAAAAAGVAVVVQPGGSVRDAEVVACADRLGLAMVFTGERQFLH